MQVLTHVNETDKNYDRFSCCINLCCYMLLIILRIKASENSLCVESEEGSTRYWAWCAMCKSFCCQTSKRRQKMFERRKLMKNILCRKRQYFMSRIATISSIIKTHLNSLSLVGWRRYHKFIVCCSRGDEHQWQYFPCFVKLLLPFYVSITDICATGERIIAYTLFCISTNLFARLIL